MQERPKKRTATRAAGATTSRTAKAAATTRTTRPRAATKARAATTTDAATAVLEAPHLPGHDEIALRAHLLYERSGHTHGRDQEFWLEAERQLLEEMNG